MRRVRTLVEQAGGRVQFMPIRELWAASGVLADTFPLDRDLARAPRPTRRAAHWIRLLLVDRALTDPERSALLTLSDTPWVPAVGAAVVAAAVAPRLGPRLRLALLGGAVVWAVRGRRVQRYVVMRRELERVAPGGVLVGDFVALRPGAGMRWVAEALDRVGGGIPLVALLPASGAPRRDAARERLYVRGLGFERVGETFAGGQAVAVLVRR